MKKTAVVRALMEEAGMAFLPGERVRVRHGPAGVWKPGIVHAVVIEPGPDSPVEYEVQCAGDRGARRYPAEALRRSIGVASLRTAPASDGAAKREA